MALIAHWTMEDAAAAVVEDSADGGGNELAGWGINPALVAGKVGDNAREFEPDGSALLQGAASGAISAAARAVFLGSSHTFAAWFRPVRGVGPQYQDVLCVAPGAQDANEVLFSVVYEDNAHQFTVGWGGALVDLVGDLADQRWTHIAVTYQRISESDGTYRLYQDGELLATYTGWALPTTDQPAAEWQMGGTPLETGGGGAALSGRLDDVRVYDTRLTDSEIAELAATVITPVTVTPAGVDVEGVDASDSGDEWENTGNEWVEITNASGSPVTVTLRIITEPDGLAVTNRTVTVADGVTKVVGPFRPGIYNNAARRAKITYSSAVGVTVKALKLF